MKATALRRMCARQRLVAALCRRSGQTIIEYAVTAVILLSTMAVCSAFLYTFKKYGGRVLDLVASEYP